MNPIEQTLAGHLAYLKLHYLKKHFQALADQAAREQWSPLQYLARLVDGEALARQDRAVQKRLKEARFPMMKTLEQFDWSWPKKANRAQVQNLFRLGWINEKANIVLMGSCGLGKTHLSIALAREACLHGHSVLFTTAVDIINSLAAAQTVGRRKLELKRYLKPAVLAIDEVGYLPIDKAGADLLFQIFSHRYERGSLLITTNQPYKLWPKIFNNDTTITSAVLDRLLHHAETIVLEGRSYRMKDQLAEE